MVVRMGGAKRSYSANPTDYRLLEEIGYGASATVHRAVFVPTNEVVAVKCLDLDRCNSNLDDIQKEAQTMSLIDHPNVIKAFCSFVVDHCLWVVMPFMAEGSCLHLMKIAYPDGFEESIIGSILKETLKALEYLHRHGHIHRDVKAGNILLDSSGVVKLGDFGVSACMFDKGDRQRTRNTFVGTPCWMAPEVLQPGNGYDFKADIWSLGITALELAHGHAPFSKYPPMKVLLMTIQNAPPGLDYERDKRFSKSFKEVVAMCLVKDQSKRPTAEKLLKHSFFKQAKPPEYSVKGLLTDLPPLWERVKNLQLKDAAQLALKKMPSAEQEALSHSEYQRGVSAWNFDVEDLKAQASLLQYDDTEGTKEEDEGMRFFVNDKYASASGSSSWKCSSANNTDFRENGVEQAKFPNAKHGSLETETLDSGDQDIISVDEKDGRSKELAFSTPEKPIMPDPSKSQPPKRRQSHSGPLIHNVVLNQPLSDKRHISERVENETQVDKAKREVRRAPSFSGPLMLSNRASANSLSAPIRSSGGYDFEHTYILDIEEPLTVNRDVKLIKSKDDQDVLPGFKVAANSDYQVERFNSPVIPNEFKPQHEFPAVLETGNKRAGPPPPEVLPPEDRNLKLLIDGFAALVTRCGKLFEDLSREKNKTNPLFSFLSGGNGYDYYARRLWEEQQKHTDKTKQDIYMKSVPSVQKLTAESRGRILGEKPLEKSYKDSGSSVASADAIQLQFNLSDTFTKPASLSDTPEVVKPFKADPAKQERFEQFLKEKYQGGLRSTESGGNSMMSESARARERLDFEAAAEVIEKGKQGSSAHLHSTQQFSEISASANLQFTSGGLEETKASKSEELTMHKMYPKREEYQWRPAPILCKRFDITDPYMGKPPPLPRARGRIDSLIFASDFVKETKSEKTFAASIDSLPSQSEVQVMSNELLNSETEIETNSVNVERPVDLYKAIFSDDSDDDAEAPTVNHTHDPEKKTEVANTTLNRLIAGDFLESLGKELGLEVPPEAPMVKDKVTNVSQKEILPTSTSNIPPGTGKTVLDVLNRPLKGKEVADSSSRLQEITPKGFNNDNEPSHGIKQGEPTYIDHFEQNYDKAEVEKISSDFKNGKRNSKRHRSRSSSLSSEDKRSKRQSRRHRRRSSSPSSEDERSRKRSKQHRSTDLSDTDSSDDHRLEKSSTLKSEKKGSSRGKSSKRKHSKHHRQKQRLYE